MNLVICAFKWFMVYLKIVTHVYVSIYTSCLWRLIAYMKSQTSCNVSWGTKERSENGWYSEYLVRPVSGLGTGQGSLGRDTERQLSGLLEHGRCIQEVTLGRSWRIVGAFYCNMGSKTIGEASLQTQDLLGGGNSLYEWDSVKLLLTLSLQSEIKNSVGGAGLWS